MKLKWNRIGLTLGILLGLGLTMLSFGIRQGWAATINDTSLASPPGVYFGSGNDNAHFTVTTENGVEVGQRAIIRYTGDITPTGNVYNAPAGQTTVPSKSGSAFGFTFSVKLDTLTLADITATLTVNDAVKGTTGSFDLLSIFDNAGYDGSNTHAIAIGTDEGFQNSEALSFAIIGSALAPSYDINADDTYTFTLDVSTKCTIVPSFAPCTPTLLAENVMVVNTGAGAPPQVAAPEPASLGYMTLLMGAIGTMTTRRLRRLRQTRSSRRD